MKKVIDGVMLHVVPEDGEWEVWLNPEGTPFSGLCIGVADTRQAAISQAADTLANIASYLKG